MPDAWELTYDLDPSNFSDWTDDPDNDFLNNRLEFHYGTNPNNPDTDGDSFNDTVEIIEGTDPTDPEDFPVDDPDVTITVTDTTTEYETDITTTTDHETTTTTEFEPTTITEYGQNLTETITEDGANLTGFIALMFTIGGILVIKTRKKRKKIKLSEL
jgi:hypothetical protein